MCCAVISKIHSWKLATPPLPSTPKSRQSQRKFDVDCSCILHTFGLNHLNNWHHSTRRFPKRFPLVSCAKCSTTRSLFQSLWHKCITRGWICTFTSNPTKFWIFCEWLSFNHILCWRYKNLLKLCFEIIMFDSRELSRNLGRNLKKSWRNLGEIWKSFLQLESCCIGKSYSTLPE